MAGKVKAKSHKGLLKRVRITGKGKVKSKRPGKSHLNSHKSGKKLTSLRRDLVASTPVAKMLERALHMRLKGREQD